MQTTISLVIIALAIYLLIKGLDVRLVLVGTGLALASLTLKPWLVLDAFRITMGDGRIVTPICSAMGYAFVLRATGSDKEMVRLLLRPIRRVRWLLVPGGCAVGFITNMAITSQTAVAASVGSILVPLMLAAEFHPIIVAATLVLGCSAGGNLFNPGEPDIIAIQQTTKVPLADILNAVFLPEFLGFAAAVITFTLLNRSKPKEVVQETPVPEVEDEKPINYVKAMLPPLPIVILILLQPRFNLFPGLLKTYPEGLPVVHAMVICTIIAMLVERKDPSGITKAFFEGLGFAFIHVISLIIAASCFIEGMKQVGLITKLVGVISGSGFLGKLASQVFPGLLAILSGSGTAPSVSFSQAVLPYISASDPTAAVNLGVLGAVGASFGRTMSPVAAVVIFTATLVKVAPIEIVKRVVPALAVGAIVALAVVLLR